MNNRETDQLTRGWQSAATERRAQARGRRKRWGSAPWRKEGTRIGRAGCRERQLSSCWRWPIFRKSAVMF